MPLTRSMFHENFANPSFVSLLKTLFIILRNWVVLRPSGTLSLIMFRLSIIRALAFAGNFNVAPSVRFDSSHSSAKRFSTVDELGKRDDVVLILDEKITRQAAMGMRGEGHFLLVQNGRYEG